jgi:hypothetical protein
MAKKRYTGGAGGESAATGGSRDHESKTRSPDLEGRSGNVPKATSYAIRRGPAMHMTIRVPFIGCEEALG